MSSSALRVLPTQDTTKLLWVEPNVFALDLEAIVRSNAYVFAIDLLQCSRYGDPRRMLAAILSPDATCKLLIASVPSSESPKQEPE